MLLGDSASLSLSCWNIHTERTNTSLRTWLSLEQIPSSTVYCNYEQLNGPIFLSDTVSIYHMVLCSKYVAILKVLHMTLTFLLALETCKYNSLRFTYETEGKRVMLVTC